MDQYVCCICQAQGCAPLWLQFKAICQRIFSVIMKCLTVAGFIIGVGAGLCVIGSIVYLNLYLKGML